MPSRDKWVKASTRATKQHCSSALSVFDFFVMFPSLSKEDLLRFSRSSPDELDVHPDVEGTTMGAETAVVALDDVDILGEEAASNGMSDEIIPTDEDTLRDLSVCASNTLDLAHE